LNEKDEMAISDQSFIRILVVDDLAAWRRCLIEKLRAEGNLQVVAVATDGTGSNSEGGGAATRLDPAGCRTP
jgi:CheY-like chemotaxis protein